MLLLEILKWSFRGAGAGGGHNLDEIQTQFRQNLDTIKTQFRRNQTKFRYNLDIMQVKFRHDLGKLYRVAYTRIYQYKTFLKKYA